MNNQNQLRQLEYEIENRWNAKEIFRATGQSNKEDKVKDELITLQMQYKMITGDYYKPEMREVRR